MNRPIVLLALSIALPFSAQAQVAKGPYFAAAIGFNKMQDEHVTAHVDGSPLPATPGEIVTSAGPAIVASFGLGLTSAIRAEIEGSYLSNHIVGETGLAGENNASGTERKVGIMANAFYEFGGTRIQPYLGAGGGVQWVHEPAATASSGGITVVAKEQTVSSLGYQGILGAEFPVQSMRGLSISTEYRYLGLAGTRTYHATVTVPGQGSFPLSDVSSSDVNHSFLLGIRYSFGH